VTHPQPPVSLPGQSARVGSIENQNELKQRIMAGIDDVNRHPVIHTWSYKLAEAA
jgi:hypothetical protein